MSPPERDLPASHDIWPPPSTATPPERDMPGWGTTIWRGMRGTCPQCAQAPIFNGYLKVCTTCRSCHAPLGDMPSDDAPPYIAMLIILHFMALIVVMIFHYGWQPTAYEYAMLLVLLVLVCLAGLRVAKGATIGVLLKLGMKRAVLT